MCPKKAPEHSALGLTEDPGLSLFGSAPARVKHNSESERRSPSSEDDKDERESRAEIQNAEDYNEIFQPKNSISEAIPSPTSQPGILLWLYALSLPCSPHSCTRLISKSGNPAPLTGGSRPPSDLL